MKYLFSRLAPAAEKSLTCGTFAAIESFGFADPRICHTVGYDVDLCKAVAKFDALP
jgi:ABC-type amino acid transport substrate-binding protein